MDIKTWTSRSSVQPYSGSDNNSRDGKTSDDWEAMPLCTLLTDRMSKYVKDAVSSYAVKDWQWLARLMEWLTHRGILWFGLIRHNISKAKRRLLRISFD